MIHVGDTCPFAKTEGGLQSVHEVENSADNWLETNDYSIREMNCLYIVLCLPVQLLVSGIWVMGRCRGFVND